MDNEYLDNLIEKLGERLKTLRIQANYRTQYEFLKAYTGSTKRSSIISRFESGVNIDFETAIKYARVLKLTLLSIFDIDGRFTLKVYEDKTPFKTRFSSELQRLGKRIKVIRENGKLTQSDIYERSGISEAKLSLYEQGKEDIEFKTIAGIAYGLGVEIWELFWEEQEDKNG